jgi:hypothetical protein
MKQNIIKKDDKQHKLCVECFTDCAKWELNITMKLNKNSKGIVNIF